MVKDIYFDLISNLGEALKVRQIRNDNRQYFTNDTKYINLFRQIWWYFTYYKKGEYKVYISRNTERQVIGYGAILVKNRIGYITECVDKRYHGQGFGEAILINLMQIANREHLLLIAEVLDTNVRSKKLHEKLGFVLHEKTERTTRYAY